MLQRKIESINRPPLRQGFLGQGHLQAIFIDGRELEKTDPFIALIDDQVDIHQAGGGPHPHGGFEIYTLVLDGKDEQFEEGTLEVMTAGKGVVHTEQFEAGTKTRIFQLWLALPPEKRWTEPFLQRIDLEKVPTLKTNDKEIRVYSGSAYELTSPIQTNTPITVVEFRLTSSTETTQEFKSSYNGFIAVAEGSVFVGDTEIKSGEIGWFNKIADVGNSTVTYKAGKDGARFVFFAGEPQKSPIMTKGSFVAGSADEMNTLFQQYRNGELMHIKTYPSKVYSDKKGKTIN